MAEQEYRIESDTIGEVKIPKEALWGPQTERSRNNFPSGELMPLAIIRAFLHLKKAAAESNVEVGDEPAEKGQSKKLSTNCWHLATKTCARTSHFTYCKPVQVLKPT